MINWPVYLAKAICLDPLDPHNQRAGKQGPQNLFGRMLEPNKDFFVTYVVQWDILPEYVSKNHKVYRIDHEAAGNDERKLCDWNNPSQVVYSGNKFILAASRVI